MLRVSQCLTVFIPGYSIIFVIGCDLYTVNIAYLLPYFLLSLMYTALESVSQNVPHEVLIACKGKAVIVGRGSMIK